MSTGLLALVDDVIGLAKLAAASMDDITAQATKAGAKAAGVVIDDAAVTPRYVVGVAAKRELSIIWRIALGSLKNKLLILLPAALLLDWAAPWAVTPLLMLGGAFLCYEGAEKVYGALFPHAAHVHEAAVAPTPADPLEIENQKVAGAIRTDFILSAEIMAITLASLAPGSFINQAIVLAVVAIGITVAVYGAVALIVKADDVGVSLAANERPVASVLGLRDAPGAASGADRALAPLTKLIGRGLVRGMPGFLVALSAVGAAAMVWVGGGIILHALHEYGVHTISDFVAALQAAVRIEPPALGATLAWLAEVLVSAAVGLLLGALLIPLVGFVGGLFRGAPKPSTP